jgi:RsiW-degrading membrane proteinase PrsW (M82 family)
MRKLILILSIAVGLATAAVGPLLGGALVVMAWLGRARESGELLQAVTIAAGLILLSLGFGLALAWAGWSALRGRPARGFRLPRWGWWLLALVVALGMGQAAFSAEILPLVPVAHIAAGVLPAFLFLSVALGSARRGGGAITTRPAIGSLAWGGLGGVGLAMVLEVILVLIAVVAFVLWMSVTDPALIGKLQAGVLEFQESGELRQELSNLMPYLTSPLVMLGILGGIAVVVPLLEEGVKSLAVPLVALTGRSLTRLDGFLLGAAAGAGFALFEGVMNGILTLSVPGGWAPLMAARAGTAAIHCCATGLAGLGWEAVLTERRWARGVGLGAAALALHGVWNLLAGAQTLLGLRDLGSTGGAAPGGQSPLTLLLVGFMGLVWVGAVLILALLPRRLARDSQPSGSNPPLGDQGYEAQDEPVDQESVEERPAAPGDPTEEGSAEDRAQRLDLGLAEMGQGKRDRLDDDGARPDDAQ